MESQFVVQHQSQSNFYQVQQLERLAIDVCKFLLDYVFLEWFHSVVVVQTVILP